MNKLTIIGNLTKDPELRTTTSGVNVCTFTVAVNRRRTQQQQQPEADFFRVTFWREKADLCVKYLDKGSKVCVIGAVSVRTYEKNGTTYASLEVDGKEVEFLGKPAGSSAPVDAQSGMEIVQDELTPFETALPV